MSIRLRVHRADGGHDDWGSVLNMGYGAADEVVSVRHSDGIGVRRKDYFSGQYTGFEMVPGGDDSTLFPIDAVKE